MSTNSTSGLYKCTVCGHIISHIQGKETLPCSKCNKNSWILINKDPDYLRTGLRIYEQTVQR